VPVLDCIVFPRGPVALKVCLPLVGCSQTAARMQPDGVSWKALLAITDDLPANSQRKHIRFFWETFSQKRRPLSASSISRGTNNRDGLTKKRRNPRTPSVDLGPWQCGTPLRDALHASCRSAPPAAEAVQPDPQDSSRREEGGEAGGRHDDRCEERRSDVRTLRVRRQESKSCHRSRWSQVGWREGHSLFRAPCGCGVSGHPPSELLEHRPLSTDEYVCGWDGPDTAEPSIGLPGARLRLAGRTENARRRERGAVDDGARGLSWGGDGCPTLSTCAVVGAWPASPTERRGLPLTKG